MRASEALGKVARGYLAALRTGAGLAIAVVLAGCLSALVAWPLWLAATSNPRAYALSIMIVWHDSYGGLRVNGKQQVIDMHGAVIPGLYAGGEAAGGFNKHGLGKGTVQGFIAGTNAAAEQRA